MPTLVNALDAWGTDAFGPTLKREIEAMKIGALPLDQGTSQGGFVDDNKIAATVLNVSDQGQTVAAEVGVFFTEIVAGCSCGDGPETINAYCRMQIRINKTTAQADIRVLSD